MSKLTSVRLPRRDVLRAGVFIAVVGSGAIAAAPARSAASASAASAGRGVALTGVTVIDGTGRPARRDMTVLVQGQRITALGRRGAVPIPPGTEIVELPGKYVIPGLCDAHVHSIPSDRISPPLYLANGVTTVREMSGSPLLHEWRDRIDRGELLGPRSVIASRIIDGAPTVGDPTVFVEVATAAQARAAVRRAKREGADFVKVYSRLPHDLYRVIADEARRQRIPFAGHCPDAVPLTAASAAAQRSVEHLYSTWYDASTREPELRARIAALTHAQGDYLTWLREIHRLEWDAINSYSARKAAKTLATLARNRTRIVPTLTVYQVLDRPYEIGPTKIPPTTTASAGAASGGIESGGIESGGIESGDGRLAYVPGSVVEGWRWALENVIKAGRGPEEAEQRHALFDHRLAFVGEMARAGVPIVAGTDAGDVPFVVPGFALHDELAFLVRAGLSPARALQAATIEPARMLGLADSIGTVERGKAADLVVLDADPLADIRNTTRIHAVMSRGRFISATQRATMLADVARAAAEPAAEAHSTSPGHP